jgi:hypothetical protein
MNFRHYDVKGCIDAAWKRNRGSGNVVYLGHKCVILCMEWLARRYSHIRKPRVALIGSFLWFTYNVLGTSRIDENKYRIM